MSLTRARFLLPFAFAACGDASSPALTDAGPRADQSAGDAAADGSEPPNVADAAPMPAQGLADVYARAAVVLGSCWPDDGVNRSLAHLWEAASFPLLWGGQLPDAACLASHGGGCEAVQACLGFVLKLDGAPCSEGCTGTVFTECYGSLGSASFDCARIGLACTDDAACVQIGAQPCNESSFVPGCDDAGRPVVCFHGYTMHGAVCEEQGLVCETGACRGQGESCADNLYTSDGLVYYGLGCDGDTLSACAGGRQHDRTCSDVGPGFSCHEFEGVSFCGLASECMPAELPNAEQRGSGDACADDMLSFCNAGRMERMRCTSLGFEGCAEGARSASCVPIEPRAGGPG